MIERNPQILDKIESLSNGQPAEPQQNSLQKPTRPQKPITYSEVDAYNDPDSESFKFRVAKDQYQDDMLTYYENVEEARTHQMREDQHRQMEQMQMQSAYSHAQQSWGFDANEARDFVSWAQNPQNITLDALGRLYRLAKAPTQQEAQVQNRMQQMQEQEQRLKAPQTTTVQPGTSAPTLTDEQSFSASLLANKRR